MGRQRRKVAVKIRGLHESEVRSNLEYWLSKTAEERISAVEVLRRQWCGVGQTEQKIQRVVRVVPMHPEEKEERQGAEGLGETPGEE